MTLLEFRTTPATLTEELMNPVQAALALRRAKYAYSTRFVFEHEDRASFGVDTDRTAVPETGDVVLARVAEIGHHKRLEGPGSRRQTLFIGDEIVVAYGSRYAADQFLATLPKDLGPCNLAAAGGLASEVIEQHDRIEDATVLEPIGRVTDAKGKPLNLRDCAPLQIAEAAAPTHRVPVIAVLGTSMNSGKSTTLACLAHGLSRAGLRVHTGKATGTGAGNDSHLFTDAGAHRVLDFTDFGLSTTFGLDYGEVRNVFASLVDELAGNTGEGMPDVVLVEVADGIYQGETRRLLSDEVFTQRVDQVVFAAGDALGAAGGVEVMRSLGHTPTLVSGVLTASPLATREAMAALDVPVVATFDLCEPGIGTSFLANNRVGA